MSLREREFRVTARAGVQPRGGIAKGFAGVFAPTAGAGSPVRGGEGALAPFRGPAELATGFVAELGGEEALPATAPGVSGTQPDEVEDLVDQNAGEFGARAVESDATFAKEGAGVDGSAPVGESGGGVDVDGVSVEGRQAPEHFGVAGVQKALTLGIGPRSRAGWRGLR